MGGLNVGNASWRVDPSDPDACWRDQHFAVTGGIVSDLVAAFDRNFDDFVGIKGAKGILNTNVYGDATRLVLDKTGEAPVRSWTCPALVARVAALEGGPPLLEFRSARCRFLQSRPRFKETYIEQAYVKLVERA